MVKLITTNISEFLKKLDEFGIKITDTFLENLGFRIERVVKEEITRLELVKTGIWRRGVHSRLIGKSKLLISDDVFYGEYHERGTGIYGPFKRRIRPKKKRALAFTATEKYKTKSGKTRRRKVGVVAKSVKGVKKSAPFSKALTKIENATKRELDELL